MKSIKHKDLIKRSQNSTGIPPDLMEDHIEFGNEWRAADKQAGFVRYEFKLSISSIRNTFSKLFGGKKSWRG